jgi:hypothetical protein
MTSLAVAELFAVENDHCRNPLCLHGLHTSTEQNMHSTAMTASRR